MPSCTIRCIAALAAGLALLSGCTGSGTTPASSRSDRPSATTTSPTGATVTPSGLPTLPALPTTLAGADPCARAGSALTAASTYLGLAELGRTDEAQRCVRGGSVARATTAALTAPDPGGFYVPTGPTSGSTISFVAGSGGSAVSVTVAHAGSGYTVTAVRRG